MHYINGRLNFVGRSTSAQSLLRVSWVDAGACASVVGKAFHSISNDASFASQDEPLLRGGEDGGGDTQEIVRGSRAAKVKSP